MTDRTPCYIFDIDGTLADIRHRLHLIEKAPKDWDAFHDACVDDAPIEHMCELTRLLARVKPIIYVSGRSDRIRNRTLQWLIDKGCARGRLYMRRHEDHRDDDILKAEILAVIRADGFEPCLVFDDRDRVVSMWRANGVPCAQVAEGNF